MRPTVSAALWAGIFSLTACALSDGQNTLQAPPSGSRQRPPQTLEKQVKIYKPDGSQQCYGGGTSPAVMEKELQGIRVYASGKQTLRGMMFPAVCGGQTGRVNVYTIAERGLPEAKKRGFAILPY